MENQIVAEQTVLEMRYTPCFDLDLPVLCFLKLLYVYRLSARRRKFRNNIFLCLHTLSLSLAVNIPVLLRAVAKSCPAPRNSRPNFIFFHGGALSQAQDKMLVIKLIHMASGIASLALVSRLLTFQPAHKFLSLAVRSIGSARRYVCTVRVLCIICALPQKTRCVAQI